MIRLYQLCEPGGEAFASGGMLFEGTLEQADDTFGIRVGLVEADLIDLARDHGWTVRYRDFSDQAEIDAYLIEPAPTIFVGVL